MIRKIVIITLAAAPTLAAAAAPPVVKKGEEYRLDGHCVTITDVKGELVSYEWKEDMGGGSGTTFPASLGKACHYTPPAPVSGLTPTQSRWIVAQHNKIRGDVKVGPVTWDADVAKVAQAWADHLAKDNACGLVHSGDHRYGENLAGEAGRPNPMLNAVPMWEAEKANYTLAPCCDAPKGVTGHYTQVVWAKSKKIGCGFASCAGGKSVTVCNYAPAGNMQGEKPY